MIMIIIRIRSWNFGLPAENAVEVRDESFDLSFPMMLMMLLSPKEQLQLEKREERGRAGGGGGAFELFAGDDYLQSVGSSAILLFALP